jgi:NTP pyrophosphatase (non-canonical NTP hydrolase)
MADIKDLMNRIYACQQSLHNSEEDGRSLLLLKFVEESGELVSEYLQRIGKATRKVSMPGALEKEAADVLITVLPFVLHFGVSADDFVKILEDKIAVFEERVKEKAYLQQKNESNSNEDLKVR